METQTGARGSRRSVRGDLDPPQSDLDHLQSADEQENPNDPDEREGGLLEVELDRGDMWEIVAAEGLGEAIS